MVSDIPGRTRVSHSGVVRKKILLVDDDTDMLALSKRLLQAEGYEVADLSDGALAMDTMAAFRPDLVVLDLLMPNISGETLLKRMREDTAYESTKIVVSSAKNFRSDQKTLLELGADAYVPNPYGSEDSVIQV